MSTLIQNCLNSQLNHPNSIHTVKQYEQSNEGIQFCFGMSLAAVVSGPRVPLEVVWSDKTFLMMDVASSRITVPPSTGREDSPSGLMNMNMV